MTGFAGHAPQRYVQSHMPDQTHSDAVKHAFGQLVCYSQLPRTWFLLQLVSVASKLKQRVYLPKSMETDIFPSSDGGANASDACGEGETLLKAFIGGDRVPPNEDVGCTGLGRCKGGLGA